MPNTVQMTLWVFEKTLRWDRKTLRWEVTRKFPGFWHNISYPSPAGMTSMLLSYFRLNLRYSQKWSHHQTFLTIVLAHRLSDVRFSLSLFMISINFWNYELSEVCLCVPQGPISGPLARIKKDPKWPCGTSKKAQFAGRRYSLARCFKETRLALCSAGHLLAWPSPLVSGQTMSTHASCLFSRGSI